MTWCRRTRGDVHLWINTRRSALRNQAQQASDASPTCTAHIDCCPSGYVVLLSTMRLVRRVNPNPRANDTILLFLFVLLFCFVFSFKEEKVIINPTISIYICLLGRLTCRETFAFTALLQLVAIHHCTALTQDGGELQLFILL